MTEFVGLACAITYEPTVAQIARTVRQIAGISKHGAVFDNSETVEIAGAVRRSCSEYDVEYLQVGENVGLAGGLNALVRYAEAAGLAWIAYLDDDSAVADAYTGLLASAVVYADSHEQVALIGSRVQLQGAVEPPGGKRFAQQRYVIASGTLMRVEALVAVDGFDETMKLDLVDHEVSLRLRAAGWQIVIDNGRTIDHEIGADGQAISARVRLRVSRHPVWRRRLMWRNSVLLTRRYFRVFPKDILKHLVARVGETIVGAWTYKDWRYLTSAGSGAVSGLRSNARTGISGRVG